MVAPDVVTVIVDGQLTVTYLLGLIQEVLDRDIYILNVISPSPLQLGKVNQPDDGLIYTYGKLKEAAYFASTLAFMFWVSAGSVTLACTELETIQ